MEMVSANQYIDLKKKHIIEELQEEKKELKDKINTLKEDINNNIPDFFDGGRNVKIQMYELYYSELDSLIEKINNL